MVVKKNGMAMALTVSPQENRCDELMGMGRLGNQYHRGHVTEKTRIESGSSWITHGLVILAVFLISTSFPVGALVADALPATVLMLIRFIMAALLLAPIVFFRHGIQLPDGKQLAGYALLSLPLVAFFWCMFEALKSTSAMNTGALYTMVPAMTAVLAFFITGERSNFRKATGLLSGMVGALYIVFRGDMDSVFSLDLNRGDLIFLAGAVALSLYNPLVKRLHRGEPTEVMTVWVIILGTLWLGLLAYPELEYSSLLQVSTGVWAGLFYLALFTTLISFYLLQLGTVRIGSTAVASYGFLNPVFVFIATLVLGWEVWSMALLPGVLLVLIAMVLIQRAS